MVVSDEGLWPRWAVRFQALGGKGPEAHSPPAFSKAFLGACPLPGRVSPFSCGSRSEGVTGRRTEKGAWF